MSENDPNSNNLDELMNEDRVTRQAPESVVMDTRGSELDPAHRELARALQTSFRVLQVVMLILIGIYLTTGFRQVQEQEKGIRLLFGDIQDEQPLAPGLHAAWPAPMGEFIRVQTASRTITVEDAFWVHLRDNERTLPFADLNRDITQGLAPGTDGSVITADQAIAHTRWQVEFRITNPALLIRNVAESERIENMGSEAETLVRKAIERGVVHATAHTELDTIIASPSSLNAPVRTYAQEILDRLGTGIEITSVLCRAARPPRAILEDYEAVNQASSQANQVIEQARDDATTTLNEVAGQAYRKLSLMIQVYESLTLGVDPAEEDVEFLCTMVANPDAVRDALDDADEFLALIDEVLVSPEVGGEVSQIVANARQYSTRLVSKLASETEQLKAYYESYAKSPSVVKMDLWNDAISNMFDYRVERFMLPPNTTLVDLRINRNAALQNLIQTRQAREEQRRAMDPNNPQNRPPGR